MDEEERKKHLKLVKSQKDRKPWRRPASEEKTESDSQSSIGTMDWQILTGPPDCTVIIDAGAPVEIKLRVLAAVKSFGLGLKSVDYALKKYGDNWEEQLRDS